MEIRKISGAAIVNDRKILLVKRKYKPHKNTWCPPGGFIDKLINESVEDCCIREVKEETNIDINIIKKLEILKIYNERKNRNEEIHIFLCKSKSNKIIVDDEVLDVKWFNLNKLDNLNLIPGFDKFTVKYKDVLIAAGISSKEEIKCYI